MGKFLKVTLLTVLTCLLCGCGAADDSLMEKQNVENITVDIGDNITVLRYLDLEFPLMDFEYSSVEYVTAYGAGARYVLSDYLLSDGEHCYFLEKRLSDTEVLESVELVFQDLEKPAGHMVGMDVVTEQDMGVLFVGEDDTFQVLHADGRGNVLDVTDVTEGYRKAGVEAEMLLDGAVGNQNKFWCDRQGNQYLLAENGYRLTVFDAQGNSRRIWDYEQDGEYYFAAGTHTPEGNLFLSRVNVVESKQEWLAVNEKRTEFSPFLNTSGIGYCQLTFLDEDTYFYSGEGGIWLVDGKQETGREIYSYKESGIEKGVTYLALTNEQEIILYLEGGNTSELLVLGTVTEEEEEQNFRVTDLYGDGYVLKSLINEYKKENGMLTTIETSNNLSQAEELWTSTMAELAAGKGPDIICIDASDERFDILYEKGILENLDGIVPEDILSQVFPGLAEAGRRNESLYGMAVYANLGAFLVYDALWQKEQWSVEEALSLLENADEIKSICLQYRGNNEGMAQPWLNLDFLALHYMENSTFAEIETGKSKYNEELFRKTLTYAKNYAQEVADGYEEQVKAGTCLVGIPWVWKPNYFAETLGTYGEDFHFIGYPGQTEGVGVWEDCCLLLVNKNSKFKEQAAEFVKYLLSAEGQRKINMDHTSVREDLIRDCVFYDEWAEEWRFMIGNNLTEGSWAFQKKDGTSYIEEYIAFLKKLEVESPQPKILQQLISEEAESFFCGDKTVEQVTEIIH